MVGIHQKGDFTHLLGLRKRHQRSSRIRATSVASTTVGTEGEEDKMTRSSA